MREPQLGDRARDTVTGCDGIVTGVSVYLNGCRRYQLEAEPSEKGGEPREWWFDEERLEVVTHGEWTPPVSDEGSDEADAPEHEPGPRGGPRSAPPRRSVR